MKYIKFFVFVFAMIQCVASFSQVEDIVVPDGYVLLKESDFFIVGIPKHPVTGESMKEELAKEVAKQKGWTELVKQASFDTLAFTTEQDLRAYVAPANKTMVSRQTNADGSVQAVYSVTEYVPNEWGQVEYGLEEFSKLVANIAKPVIKEYLIGEQLKAAQEQIEERERIFEEEIEEAFKEVIVK